MVQVLFVEHDDVDVDFNAKGSQIGGISAELVCKALDGLGKRARLTCEATHVIAHVDESQLKTLKSAWEKCAADLIVVRISKGAQYLLQTRKHEVWTNCRDGKQLHAYVLNVRNQRLLESDSSDAKDACAYIASIFSMTLDDARAIAIETVETISAPLLKEIFCRPTETPIIIALAILCQGYLIVCANQGGEGYLPECLKQWRGKSQATYSARKHDVQQQKFWDVFGEKDSTKLIGAAAIEWNWLHGGGDFTYVEQLIRRLPTKEKPLVEDDVAWVSKAYDAIAATLRSTRGV